MSRTELGEILGGISARAVAIAAQKGYVVKVGHGKFDLFESIATYCRHQRAVTRLHTSADGQIDAVAESALLKRANRAIVEMKQAQIEGKLISLDEVEEIQGHAMRTIRSMIQALPGRVGFALPHLTQHDLKSLRNECDEILLSNNMLPEKEKGK